MSPIGVAPPVSDDCAPIGSTAGDGPQHAPRPRASLRRRREARGVAAGKVRGVFEERARRTIAGRADRRRRGAPRGRRASRDCSQTGGRQPRSGSTRGEQLLIRRYWNSRPSKNCFTPTRSSLAVRAVVVDVAEDAVDAVGRDAGVAQIQAVGRAGAHHRHDDHAGKHRLGDRLERLHHLAAAAATAGSASLRPTNDDRDPRIGEHFDQLLLDRRRRLAGQDAAVDVRRRQLRQRVVGVAARERVATQVVRISAL